MPIIRSGIYNCTATNHYSSYGNYAAWNVRNCKVVRFKNKTSFYASDSKDIDVHRRTADSIVPYGNSWVNACGCVLIGRSGRTEDDDYAHFIAAVGLVRPGSSGSIKYQYEISGTLIVDRTYARAYFQAVGFSDDAIALIGATVQPPT